MSSFMIWTGLPIAIAQSKYQIHMSEFIPHLKFGLPLFFMVKQPFV